MTELTDLQKEFIIRTAILIMAETGNELECRRQIINFLTIANFSTEQLQRVEDAIVAYKNSKSNI